MITILQGDITKLAVDVIVNAANKSLLGGGGVDGAIHKAAGPKLLEECKTLGGANTGEAKITHGYELPARWVIHTVGPVYRDGKHGEPELLKHCYENSLCIARSYGLKSIAFPSISTGAYRYPIEEASTIALQTIHNWLKECTYYEMEVICVLHSNYDYQIYLTKAQEYNIPFSTTLQ